MFVLVRKQLFHQLGQSVRFKHGIDYSKVPKLLETDLEEQFVRGSGPGGQKINKTASCVVIKHIPTGIVVKNQESRSQEQNRKNARSILISKLDNLINGENSVEAQLKRIQDKKSNVKQSKKEKLRSLKEKWKERENII
ncbi:mitochondrial translation release factor in rescue [Aethina tumida]|uniref:mitochondrial translation release factor in rescue n=1 Tax=Aethina tumida TaxID=116153 RepID=UPI00096AF16E|nr:mitochondrial translation release factor in rescue [Aethina tumida]